MDRFYYIIIIFTFLCFGVCVEQNYNIYSNGGIFSQGAAWSYSIYQLYGQQKWALRSYEERNDWTEIMSANAFSHPREVKAVFFLFLIYSFKS